MNLLSLVGVIADMFRKLGWVLLTYSAVFTAIRAAVYVLDPARYNPLFAPNYLQMLPLVLTHGMTGVVALALGPFLLTGGPGFPHRTAGKIYAACVLVGGVSGLWMGWRAYGGLSSQLGFTLMSTLWLATLVQGLRSRRQHRRWMQRNYALTFSALLLRFYLNGVKAVGWDYSLAYPFVTWLSWLPTLALTELYIRKGDRDRASMRRMP